MMTAAVTTPQRHGNNNNSNGAASYLPVGMAAPAHLMVNGNPTKFQAPSPAPSLTETTYPNVNFKKIIGTVVLGDVGIFFHPMAGGGGVSTIPWADVVKHQVSPASYPKHLLKLVLRSTGKHVTFGLKSRVDLERIRRDATVRLNLLRRNLHGVPTQLPAATTTGRQRGFDASSPNSKRPAPLRDSISSPSRPTLGGRKSAAKKQRLFGDIDPDALAVTRSSLLSSNPSLREQHKHLVLDTQTMTEDDFWETHSRSLADEHARIHGRVKAGTPSSIKSSLDLGPRGRVRLGVEEMRQIFILYPAVHRAYVEKVPLELSEEQFWRKYLESEYFHRDRGRIGSHIGKVNKFELKEKEKMDAAALNSSAGAGGAADDKTKGDTDDANVDAQEEKDLEAAARTAAAGTNDIFSRTDAEMRRKEKIGGAAAAARRRRLGTDLAVGKFDLAATANTERGNRLLLEGGRDLHPHPPDETTGSRVIDKYNRHWAMVLNPEDASAGSDLVAVARRSVQHKLDDDDDAKAGGGVDQEMVRLTRFANAKEGRADHVKGLGDVSDDEGEPTLFQELTLHNEAAYAGESLQQNPANNGAKAHKEMAQRRAVFCKVITSKSQEMAAPVLERDKKGAPPSSLPILDNTLPSPQLGRELLVALTKKMLAGARSDADAVKMASDLPENFRLNLVAYFRRSSELLRHFFGITNAMKEEDSSSLEDESQKKKIKRIVEGMEAVYREMEATRNSLPQTESGEIMRKMCLPIMDQLDWAFKLHGQLHRDGSGGGSGGGFVEEEIF